MNVQEAGSRPTRAIVDLGALRHNMRSIRGLIGSGPDILAVVKADAYGHGAIEVAQACLQEGAAMLGVATAGEGAELRRAGITVPILLQCCVSESEIEFALKNRLTLTVPSVGFAKGVSVAAARDGSVAAVHADIDTGMGRIGFSPGTAVREILEVSRLPNLTIDGIYTHFCTSELQDDPLTLAQLDLFRSILEQLAKQRVTPLHTHAANSGAVVNYPQACLTLVRPGLILYGVYPDKKLRDKIDLKPVLRFETIVTFLKTIPAGTTLGYGRTYTARRETKVATLNVGYADGYPWRLSNRAIVLVRGRRAPVVGRVSMDQLLVDVTEVPHVQLGEKVVLLGQDGSERITAENLAEWAGTISYEILCGISKRVPRLYID